MMPPKPKPESEKVVFDKPISFRWNGKKHTHHATAIAVLTEKRAEGHRDCEIFADAIIRARGLKVKTGTQTDVLNRLERIEGKIDEQAQHYALIVEALQNMDLSAFVNTRTGRTFGEELGERVPESAYNQIAQSVSGQEFDVD